MEKVPHNLQFTFYFRLKIVHPVFFVVVVVVVLFCWLLRPFFTNNTGSVVATALSSVIN